MRILLKKCRIVDESGISSPKDILIVDGTIESIASDISEKADEVIEGDDLHVSAGWIDLGVQAWDPGNEHREDLDTVREAAAVGGYTAVSLWPDTDPCTDSKAGVRYILEQAERHPVDLLPMGALSKGCAGKDITEMIDMRAAGAVAFSDGLHPVKNNGLFLRALQYVKAFDGLIIHFPFDDSIDKNGQMHEGEVSTSLGLPGIPSLAEELMVVRDLRLLEYSESRLFLANISAKGAVARIREAKAAGLKVNCSVPVWNLIYEDDKLSEFDSLYKMLPPLRSSEDREALIEGVLDGTIDHITSNHLPWEDENKSLEFPYANFGATGLETTFALMQTHLSERIPLEKQIAALSSKVHAILGKAQGKPEAGQPANLTVFSPKGKWMYSRDKVKSRSLNNPVIGESLTGRVKAVLRNNWYRIID
ncbi:MAG: dihydroorotase [Bacteroidetes bacterium]|nr:dihydroorotase [Bacteroidota bacterium]